MSDGFFRNSEISSFKKRAPLPPVLNAPRPKAKEKKEKKYEGLDEWQAVMDIEVYPNYFLIKFMRMTDERVWGFERTQYEELDYRGINFLLDSYEVITFNGTNFDIPILEYAMTGASNKQLYDATQDLIGNGLSSYKFREKHSLSRDFSIDHIDLSEVAPGVRISLKLYGGRLHCKRMQDLPYDPHKWLTDDEMDKVNEYCDRDLDKTKLLFLDLLPQINLRRTLSKRYKMDLRSKSDAQIAEAVITSELTKMLPRGQKLEKREIASSTFRYKAPAFISYNDPTLKKALQIVTTERFQIEANGRISMPKELEELQVKLGSSVYNMGMGGLHSTEKKTFHVATADIALWDWDVTSYYPEIIRQLKLYPKQLGPNFLPVYCGIIDERVVAKVEAKRCKDNGDEKGEKDNKVKADCFKIIVNGSFGKLGSPYSILYAPELMIQVTVTGQLSLLMLIEMLENKGINVVSGNTDGIVMKCPKNKEDMMKKIIKHWESLTGFTMESENYLGLFSRDVNNYIAVKMDGNVKLKGTYAESGINKNPEHDICTDALIDYIRFGTPIEETIKNCKDIKKFVTVRTVNGGAVKYYDKFVPVHSSKVELIRMAGMHPDRKSLDWTYKLAVAELTKHNHTEYLGKAVRWYYSTIENGPITYQVSGKQVPVSDDCKPIMDITIPFPDDMDYLWYINKTKELFG